MTHPVTGADLLYVGAMQTDSIVGPARGRERGAPRPVLGGPLRTRQRLRARLVARRPARLGQPGPAPRPQCGGGAPHPSARPRRQHRRPPPQSLIPHLAEEVHPCTISSSAPGPSSTAPGRPGATADVAIDDGIVTEIGRVGKGRREIDADGALVTPGFVDVHTHFDGQATWDPHLTPSCWHGVTTAVIGQLRRGLRPGRPHQARMAHRPDGGRRGHPRHARSTRGWPSTGSRFPEYLDALERMPRAIDIGTHVPHGAVRAYVMGERGARNEASTADDIDAMATIVEGALRAGALGLLHQPHTRAPRDRRRAGARHLRRGGRAVRHRPGARDRRARRVRAGPGRHRR